MRTGSDLKSSLSLVKTAIASDVQEEGKIILLTTFDEEMAFVGIPSIKLSALESTNVRRNGVLVPEKRSMELDLGAKGQGSDDELSIKRRVQEEWKWLAWAQ